MHKIVLVSGVTGVGKSQLAQALARSLGGEVIVGDSLQLYKEFQVSANCEQVRSVPYHLLAERGVFQERVHSFQYRRLLLHRVQDILSRQKTVIIEGGAGFYLKALLTQTDLDLDHDGALSQATQQVAQLGDSLPLLERELQATLKDKTLFQAGHFENNLYQLRKALVYARLSKGQSMAKPEGDPEEQLINRYDVRAVFLSAPMDYLRETINRRCTLILQKGLLREVAAFMQQGGHLSHYKDIPRPLGFSEGISLIQNYKKLKDNTDRRDRKQLKAFQKESNRLMLDFLQSYEDQSRHYARKQHVFYKSQLSQHLLHIDVSALSGSLEERVKQVVARDRAEHDLELKAQVLGSQNQGRHTARQAHSKYADRDQTVLPGLKAQLDRIVSHTLL